MMRPLADGWSGILLWHKGLALIGNPARKNEGGDNEDREFGVQTGSGPY